jgi:HlyD family secretion protein
VWLQPETVQNVVNYTVVVDADNPDGLLLPGMTASLDFLIEEKRDVLMVSSSALKIEPNGEMRAALQKRMQERFGGRPDSTRQGSEGGREGFGGQMQAGGFPFGGMSMGQSGRPANMAMLWYLDEKGELAMQPVRTSTTDGKNTEIIPMRGELKEGLKVIASVTEEVEETQNNTRPAFGGGFGGPPR